MIKALQKKFVVTAMAAVTVLMLLMLGAVNAANLIITGNEIERRLELISGEETEPGMKPDMDPGKGHEPGAPPPGLDMRAPKNDYDTVMSSNFFVLRFDENGSIVYVDVSRTSAVSEEDAKAYAQEVYQTGKETGKSGRFRYLVRSSPAGQGKTVIFLDISEERVSGLRVLLLSGAAGCVCWALMFAFVALLSRRAIRPIAESMERQKQFVTNAGHEIKTPLAIIQSNTEAMELYNGENKWSRNIKEQTMRLDGLMKNLLTLARMDEGGMKGKAVEFSAGSLLVEVVDEFMEPFKLRGISVQTDIQEDVYICADREQVGQLFAILLDNALKYTDDNGRVRCAVCRSGERSVIRVENTCEALPEVLPEKLFDRFYRADGARTQKGHGGYGIGLSMARFIAEASKGMIRAEYREGNVVSFEVEFAGEM